MSVKFRLEIPVPAGGWLSIFEARTFAGIDEWIDATVEAVEKAKVPAFRTVAIRAKVCLSPDPPPGRRIYVAEDVRPSLTAATTGLMAAEVVESTDRRHVVVSVMAMGPHVGEGAERLALELVEVGNG